MVETFVSWVIWAIDAVWPFPILMISLAVAVMLAARLGGVAVSSIPVFATICFLLICIPFGTPALLIFGARVTAPLIYQYGEPGRATILSSELTGNIFNDRPVRRYAVSIERADGAVIDTHFDSADFNVHPAQSQVRYPATGVPFDVRYLARYPGLFVIVADGQ